MTMWVISLNDLEYSILLRNESLESLESESKPEIERKHLHHKDFTN